MLLTVPFCLAHPPQKIILTIVIALGGLCFGHATALAQTDSLVMNNGNVIIGEIKSMEKNVLTIETDYSDSDFKIEWDKIQKVYSDGDRMYLITLADGTRLNASLRTDTTDARRIILSGEDVNLRSNIIDVVFIKPVEEAFINRLSASLDVGYNYTRDNHLQQFSIRSNIGYLDKYWSFNSYFDAVRSIQDDAENVRRTNANTTFRYFFGNDWYLLLSVDLLQNDEQKLQLRTATKSGIGKYAIHSNSAYFGIAVGVAWNNENFTDEELTDKNSAESFIGAELNLFNMGDLNLLTNLTAYPSLTEKGRIRADFKFDLKYDLPLDFYISLGYTHNFDNQPVEGAVKNDFVFQTSVGWKL
jgi:hypothetical protein